MFIIVRPLGGAVAPWFGRTRSECQRELLRGSSELIQVFYWCRSAQHDLSSGGSQMGKVGKDQSAFTGKVTLLRVPLFYFCHLTLDCPFTSVPVFVRKAPLDLWRPSSLTRYVHQYTGICLTIVNPSRGNGEGGRFLSFRKSASQYFPIRSKINGNWWCRVDSCARLPARLSGDGS